MGGIYDTDGSVKCPAPIGFVQVSYQGIMNPSTATNNYPRSQSDEIRSSNCLGMYRMLPFLSLCVCVVWLVACCSCNRLSRLSIIPCLCAMLLWWKLCYFLTELPGHIGYLCIGQRFLRQTAKAIIVSKTPALSSSSPKFSPEIGGPHTPRLMFIKIELGDNLNRVRSHDQYESLKMSNGIKMISMVRFMTDHL